MSDIDLNLIKITDSKENIFTVQNKMNDKIVNINKNQLYQIQQKHDLLLELQQKGFFSKREKPPLFKKTIESFFDFGKIGSSKNGTVCILGIPFDSCSTGLNGSSSAPDILRKVSSGYSTEEIDIMNNLNKFSHLDSSYFRDIYDAGNVLYIPGEAVEEFHQRIEDVTSYLSSTFGIKKLISIGGDHSSTLPLIKSLTSNEIILLKFDAHFDNNIKKDYEKTNHANFICEISSLSKVKKIFHLGVRENSYNKFLTDKDVLVPPDDFSNIDKIIENVLKEGTDFYISIDFDVIDPSYFKSTGFIVPFGLQVTQITEFLQKARNLNILGIDLMEYNPLIDTSRSDQYLCASLLRECIRII